MIMGLCDIQEIALNGSAFDQEVFEQSKKDVHFNIAKMAANTESKS